MESPWLNIGYGNRVALRRVVAVLHVSSAPVKRMREKAASEGRLIDATQGRRTRALIIMDSQHVVLSAVQPDTLAGRSGVNELMEKDQA